MGGKGFTQERNLPTLWVGEGVEKAAGGLGKVLGRGREEIIGRGQGRVPVLTSWLVRESRYMMMARREFPCAAMSTFWPLNRRGSTFSLKYATARSAHISRLSPLGGGTSYDRRQRVTFSVPNLSAVSFLFSPCKSPYLPSHKSQVIRAQSSTLTTSSYAQQQAIWAQSSTLAPDHQQLLPCPRVLLNSTISRPYAATADQQHGILALQHHR